MFPDRDFFFFPDALLLSSIHKRCIYVEQHVCVEVILEIYVLTPPPCTWLGLAVELQTGISKERTRAGGCGLRLLSEDVLLYRNRIVCTGRVKREVKNKTCCFNRRCVFFFDNLSLACVRYVTLLSTSTQPPPSPAQPTPHLIFSPSSCSISCISYVTSSTYGLNQNKPNQTAPHRTTTFFFFYSEFAILGQGRGAEPPSPSVPKSDEARVALSAALREHFLFAQLAPADLATCVDVMGALEVAAGEDVVVQGEQGSRFFVVESGSAEV